MIKSDIYTYQHNRKDVAEEEGESEDRLKVESGREMMR